MAEMLASVAAAFKFQFKPDVESADGGATC